MTKESIDLATGLFQKVVHHDTVPKLWVVVFEFGVSCEFYPIVFDHVFEGFVAA